MTKNHTDCGFKTLETLEAQAHFLFFALAFGLFFWGWGSSVLDGGSLRLIDLIEKHIASI